MSAFNVKILILFSNFLSFSSVFICLFLLSSVFFLPFVLSLRSLYTPPSLLSLFSLPFFCLSLFLYFSADLFLLFLLLPSYLSLLSLYSSPPPNPFPPPLPTTAPRFSLFFDQMNHRGRKRDRPVRWLCWREGKRERLVVRWSDTVGWLYLCFFTQSGLALLLLLSFLLFLYATGVGLAYVGCGGTVSDLSVAWAEVDGVTGRTDSRTISEGGDVGDVWGGGCEWVGEQGWFGVVAVSGWL